MIVPCHSFYIAPIGCLRITDDGTRITALTLEGEGTGITETRIFSPLTQMLALQLDEYFARIRTSFTVPFATDIGTPFQQAVYAALRTIPYGETRSYGQLAVLAGVPHSARAVGGALHRNPLLLLNPCHRVLGATGQLTGFACGLSVKAQLLQLEHFSLDDTPEKRSLFHV